MKKNARWGFFAILLAAVLASEHVKATTILFQQGVQENVGSGISHLPQDAALRFDLPDGPSFASTVDWPKDHAPGEVAFGTLPAPSPFPAGAKSDRPSTAADFPSSRPSLSEGEMAVWKSNDEPEDWLFQLQFVKASGYEAPEPSPLIPIPEPATGILVLMGIAGRMALKCFGGAPNRNA